MDERFNDTIVYLLECEFDLRRWYDLAIDPVDREELSSMIHSLELARLVLYCNIDRFKFSKKGEK